MQLEKVQQLLRIYERLLPGLREPHMQLLWQLHHRSTNAFQYILRE